MTNVTKTSTIAETPKDGDWYLIPSSDEKHGHFIRWNLEHDIWQSMIVDENGTPKFAEWMKDGEEIA